MRRVGAAHNRYKHGATGTPEHRTWLAMKARCGNPNNKSFARYGGRGIRVCDRWMEFSAFLADMGPRPEGMTLERKDYDGDYEPSNCVWADRTTQARNRSYVHVTMADAAWVRAMRLCGDTQEAIAKETGISRSHVGRICRDQSWAIGTSCPQPSRLKSHCKAGHLMSWANVYTEKDGSRGCRACRNEASRRNKAKKRQYVASIEKESLTEKAA